MVELYNIGMATLILVGLGSLIYIVAINPYLKYLEYLKQREEFVRASCERMFYTKNYTIDSDNTFSCNGNRKFQITFKREGNDFKITEIR